LPEGVELSQPPGSLPVSEGIQSRVFRIPWFKHYWPDVIEQYAAAFRKVAENHQELLTDDPGDPPEIGSWGMTRRRGG
jgi:perosamine synthetase